MKSKYNDQRLITSLLLFVTIVTLHLTLSACSSESAGTDTIPGSVATNPTEGESQTPTALITDTVTPTTSPSIVILLTPSGADPMLVADLEALLTELAEGDGLILQVTSDLSATELTDNVQIVVAVSPDPGIQELAKLAPQTQFLAVGIPGVEPASNLSVLGAQGGRPDQQGFIAGYLAATITPDWRVGVISSSDTVPGVAARRAFNNGVIFFCGLCRASKPPFVEYPQFYEVPLTADQSEVQNAVDYLINNAVQAVYVFPDVGDPDLYQYLAQAGVVIIGGETPLDTMQDYWAATIAPDLIYPVREIWSRLLAGETGIRVDTPITISDQNPTLFSPGRQRLVEYTLSELLTGYIDTGVDPLTGETD